MADFSNALVKFKINSKFKKAFEQALGDLNDTSSFYSDWPFDRILENGSYLTKEEYVGYDYEEDEIDFLSNHFSMRIGTFTNLDGDFSIPDIQSMTENLVILNFARRWGTVDVLRKEIERFLSLVADEVYFCEIIGIIELNFSFVFSEEDDKDDYHYHFVSFDIEKIETEFGIDFYLRERERRRVFYED